MCTSISALATLSSTLFPCRLRFPRRRPTEALSSQSLLSLFHQRGPLALIESVKLVQQLLLGGICCRKKKRDVYFIDREDVECKEIIKNEEKRSSNGDDNQYLATKKHETLETPGN